MEPALLLQQFVHQGLAHVERSGGVPPLAASRSEQVVVSEAEHVVDLLQQRQVTGVGGRLRSDRCGRDVDSHQGRLGQRVEHAVQEHVVVLFPCFEGRGCVVDGQRLRIELCRHCRREQFLTPHDRAGRRQFRRDDWIAGDEPVEALQGAARQQQLQACGRRGGEGLAGQRDRETLHAVVLPGGRRPVVQLQRE